MFAYDDDELRGIVDEGLSHADPHQTTRKARFHLSTVARIALMMRKFERASSTSYKKSLQYVFDKEEAISLLKMEKANCDLDVVTRLPKQAYFIRKFQLNWSEFLDTDPDFMESAVVGLNVGSPEDGYDVQIGFLFSMAIKYLYRNSCGMRNSAKVWSAGEIIQLLGACDDGAVKVELTWALGFLMSSSDVVKQELLDAKMSSDINTFILSNSEIGDEAKGFLLNQMNVIRSKCSQFHYYA